MRLVIANFANRMRATKILHPCMLMRYKTKSFQVICLKKQWHLGQENSNYEKLVTLYRIGNLFPLIARIVSATNVSKMGSKCLLAD